MEYAPDKQKLTQFPPGGNHIAVEVQHCLNIHFCSWIPSVQYLLGFWFEKRLVASQLKAEQSKLFYMVNSESKIFLKNKIYMGLNTEIVAMVQNSSKMRLFFMVLQLDRVQPSDR